MNVFILICFRLQNLGIRKNQGTQLDADERAEQVGCYSEYSFFQRTPNVWNTLSTECVHGSSDTMFKNRIVKYIIRAGLHLDVNMWTLHKPE